MRGRHIFAGLLLLAAAPIGSVDARSQASGITVTLRRQWALPPDQIVCTGTCHRGADLDVTVWADGRTVEGAGSAGISKDSAARFSEILRPFRPSGRDAVADSSKLSPDFCPVKVQWPADKSGKRPVLCGTYNGAADSLFSAIMKALRSIQLDVSVPGTF